MDNNERNTIYKDEMYNSERKERFLNQDKFSEDSKKTYKRVFLISRGLEETWEKDLVDFTLDEIKELLLSMRPLTRISSKSNIAMVNAYIVWAMENGYRSSQSNINPLQGHTSDNDFIKEFVVKDIQLYISKDELDDILDECRNYQDKVVFDAMFSGITTSELRQMKKEDIKDGYVLLRDDEGNIKLDENNNPIKFELSERSIVILNRAAEETFYQMYLNEDKIVRKETVDLVDNDYVLRVGKTQNKFPVDPVKSHVIIRRVNVLSELTANPHLTPKNIVRSGHIYEGFKLWDAAGRPNLPDGYLTTEMYHSICKKFNMPKVQNNNYMSYNTNSLRQYLNLDSIKSLYLD